MTLHHDRRRTALKLLAPLLALGLVATACGSDDDNGENISAESDPAITDVPTPAGGSSVEIPDGPTIRLRAQDFSESITITEVYGQYLEAQGYDVEILTPAGFRAEALEGLVNGDFDLIIDYIGGTQAALAPSAVPSRRPRGDRRHHHRRPGTDGPRDAAVLPRGRRRRVRRAR